MGGIDAPGIRVAIFENEIYANGFCIDLDLSGIRPNDTGDPDAGANLRQNFPILPSTMASASSGETVWERAGEMGREMPEPAIEWFCTIPFGMNPGGMAAWIYQGDGLKLWEETYAAFNLVPRPAMGNAPQMAGWFRKKITTIGGYKGLKLRIPNLGGQVYARAGATTSSGAIPKHSAPAGSTTSCTAHATSSRGCPRGCTRGR